MCPGNGPGTGKPPVSHLLTVLLSEVDANVFTSKKKKDAADGTDSENARQSNHIFSAFRFQRRSAVGSSLLCEET